MEPPICPCDAPWTPEYKESHPEPERELTFQEALIKFNEENPWPFDIHEE